MITCPNCNEPLVSIHLVRETTAEMIYEDDAFVEISWQGNDVMVERREILMNSQETVGETLARYSKAMCGNCDEPIDELDGISALETVLENAFEDDDES